MLHTDEHDHVNHTWRSMTVITRGALCNALSQPGEDSPGMNCCAAVRADGEPNPENLTWEINLIFCTGIIEFRKGSSTNCWGCWIELALRPILLELHCLEQMAGHCCILALGYSAPRAKVQRHPPVCLTTTAKDNRLRSYSMFLEEIENQCCSVDSLNKWLGLFRTYTIS
jgi:hypothetical protein